LNIENRDKNNNKEKEFNESKSLIKNNLINNSNSSRKEPKKLNEYNSNNINSNNHNSRENSNIDLKNNFIYKTSTNPIDKIKEKYIETNNQDNNQFKPLDTLNSMKGKYRKEPIVFDTFRNAELEFHHSKSNSLHNTLQNTMKLQDANTHANIGTRDCVKNDRDIPNA